MKDSISRKTQPEHLFHKSQPASISKPSLAGILITEKSRLLGESMPMQKLKALLHRVSAVDSPVLITGETGTGKELVAQAIHQQSARHAQPLVSINCAALPEGLLESELFGYERGAFTGAQTTCGGKLKAASGGTILLDEIGDMSLGAQAKILRFIETQEIYPLGSRKPTILNVRILAATHQNLEAMIAQQAFRKDLFYRLHVVRIQLPPLRARKEDIPLLLEYYLQIVNARWGQTVPGFSQEALAFLLHYDWPGNVRELKNLVEALCLDPPSGEIERAHLPKSICPKLSATESLPLSERERLLSVLAATHGNKSKAATQLGWSRMTLYRKMAKYHLF